MQENIVRADGRSYNALRPIAISYDVYGYADASVLLELGNTKLLCSVHLQQGVPSFLKGKKTGWLHAEYAMLPCATNIRTTRELSACKRNGRSVEISRLIGRSLRPMINFEALGEQTIHIDCDVLQADGSTRTTAITGAAIAIARAEQRWLERGQIKNSIVQDAVAAVSIGVREQQILLDIDFAEDSMIDADFNIILNRQGAIIEMQGTAEKKAVAWELFSRMHAVAYAGTAPLFALFDACNASKSNAESMQADTEKQSAPMIKQLNKSVQQSEHHKSADGASPLFSLRNRFNNAS